MEEIRLLGKEDIDVRVAQTNVYNNNGQTVVKASLLLYKNARIDMKILDELFTPFGWKRSHVVINNNLFCRVEVLNPDTKEWIYKEDVGTESNTEAEKGQASDAFKRACVNWGIGRELYTAPKVTVTLSDNEFTKGQDGRIRVWASFHVHSIAYDKKSRTVTALEIADRNGTVRFTMGSPAQPLPKRSAKQAQATVPAQTSAPMTLTDAEYRKIVKAFAEGRVTKSGGNYRDAWIQMVKPSAEQIVQFDNDVNAVRGY